MLPVLLEMLLVLPLRFCVWKSCDDQLMARDCSSWLSWRNLYFSDSFLRREIAHRRRQRWKWREEKYISKAITNHYLFIIYVCLLSLNIRREEKKSIKNENFQKHQIDDDCRESRRSERREEHYSATFSPWVMRCANFQEQTSWAVLVIFRSTFEGACMAVVIAPPSLVNYWERTIGNIGKIKQLELENQNLIPLMTNTSLHAKWKFISWRERQGKKGLIESFVRNWSKKFE